MQKYIEKIIAQTRKKKFKESPQLTLGQFIAEIERCGLKKDDGDDKEICFDFGTAIPTTLDSWRGAYDELALGYKLTGYDNEAEHMSTAKASAILDILKAAIGREFTGWKGGEFIMNEDTPVWVSNFGDGCNSAVVGVLDDGWRLIIITAYCEY